MTVACSALAGAQSAESYRRQLDVLEPARQQAYAAMKAKEKSRQRQAGAVTIERGSIRIVADSSVAAYVLGAVDSVVRVIDATFGSGARLLAQHPVVARERRTVENGDTVTRFIIQTGGQENVIALGDSAGMRKQIIDVLTGRAAAAPLHDALDDSLKRWFGAALPAAPESRADRAMAYAEIVTASTGLSRRCVEGELRGCRELLGLSQVADPIVDGYTATQRQALVARLSQLRRYETAGEYDRCVGDGEDVACIARLREIPEETILWWTANVGLRRSFARAALTRGGPDAYERLRSSDTLPLDARFAAAARMPVDSLVMAWRADVLAARPSAASVTPATALATLAWIAACGALALRSSRWR